MDYQEVIKNLNYVRSCEECINGMTDCKECDETIEFAKKSIEELKRLKENCFSGIELAKIASSINKLQKYEQLGTLEEVKCKIGAYEQIKWERDVAIEQLSEIGCSLGQKMDEIRTAVEKNRGIAPETLTSSQDTKIGNITFRKGTKIHKCGCCKSFVSRSSKYCHECGQAIDWSVNEC